MNLGSRLHDLFIRDYQTGDFDRLLTRDTRNTVDWYLSDSGLEAPGTRDWKWYAIQLPRLMLVAFLRKLLPARRILFAAGTALFLWGLLEGNFHFILFGFLIPVYLLFLELADKHILKTELDVASDIQRSLLPSELPDLPGYSVSFRSVPASVVGGDFIRFEPMSGGRWMVMTGDVSGKGMKAALYMVRLISLLRFLATTAETIASLLAGLNSAIRSQFPRQVFVTAGTVLFTGEDSLTLVRNGHLPFYRFTAETGVIEPVSPKGAALGLHPEKSFEASLESISVRLKRGDWILMISDGVTECMNADQEEYGTSRLAALLSRGKLAAPDTLLSALLQDLDRFRGSHPAQDDISLVLIRKD